MDGVTVIDHPLVQHKLTIMRKKETSTAGFRRLLREISTLLCYEVTRDLPFEVERIYFVTGLQAELPRGFHAHHRTRQFAVCVAGSCRFVMAWPDGRREDFLLERAAQGILIDRMVWHEMHDFSEDCVLLVLADLPYDEADYIRRRDAWEALVRG